MVIHGIGEGTAACNFLAECREIWVNANFVAGDLSLPGGRRTFAGDVLREAGPVDIIVLKGSVQIRRPLEDIPRIEAEAQMETSFLSSMEIPQVLVPKMREKNGAGSLPSAASNMQNRIPRYSSIPHRKQRI